MKFRRDYWGTSRKSRVRHNPIDLLWPFTIFQLTGYALAGCEEAGYAIFMSVAEIQKSVSGLPEKERAKLAAWLLDSLPPSSEDDGAADSVAEAARRREELDSGRLSPIPAEEFWAGIERERKQWR